MNWNDITIKQYKGIAALSPNDYDELTYIAKLLAIVTNKTEEEILNTPVDDFKSESKKLDFLNDNPKPRLPEKKYTVNGKTYIFTPNASKMTAGQYIDYTTTLNNDPENFAFLCAILLIPEGKTYGEDYDVNELAQEFNEHFKMVDVIGISFFFREALKALTKVTLTYLTKKLRKEMKKEKNPERIKAIETAINQIKTNGLGTLR